MNQSNKYEKLKCLFFLLNIISIISLNIKYNKKTIIIMLKCQLLFSNKKHTCKKKIKKDQLSQLFKRCSSKGNNIYLDVLIRIY